MTSRERVIAALSHQESDRIPVFEEIWGTTRERWIREGMPATESLDHFFGIDPFVVCCFDASFRLPAKTIAETPEYVINQDANGVRVKNLKHATATPEIIATTINSRQAWDEYKHLLEFTPDRVDWNAVMSASQQARLNGSFLHLNMSFEYERWGSIVGLENYLVALVDDPEWVREMHETDVLFFLAAYEEMTGRGIEFDGARFSNDMGYNKGPLFSPRVYRELFQPGLRRLCDFFHQRGVFTILHSCGNVMPLIPDIISTGFDCLNPIEVKAGMDLLEIKKDYGEQLCLMGGIDARKMSAEDAIIVSEIRTKVTAAKKDGGYIFHSDHTVPDDVSLEQYRRIVELAFHYGSYA